MAPGAWRRCVSGRFSLSRDETWLLESESMSYSDDDRLRTHLPSRPSHPASAAGYLDECAARFPVFQLSIRVPVPSWRWRRTSTARLHLSSLTDADLSLKPSRAARHGTVGGRRRLN